MRKELSKVSPVAAGLRTSRMSVIFVYIEKHDSQNFYGRFYSIYGSAVSFRGPLEMIKKMDGIFDRLSLPQKMFEYRYFPAAGKKETESDEITEEPEMKQEEILKEHEEKATFIIHVKLRRNATWQGEIKWVDRDMSSFFRSDLEMLRLMDDALSSMGPSEEKAVWKHE